MMKALSVNLIGAMSLNGVVGANGSLPWRLPSDLRSFKNLTTGQVVVMGRKTFESIGGKPLANRVNIVLTSNRNLDLGKDVVLAHSVEHVMTEAVRMPSVTELWVIGGTSVWEEFADLADRVVLTTVQRKVSGGDTFWPTGVPVRTSEVGSDWVKEKPTETIHDPAGYMVDCPETRGITYYLDHLVKKNTETK